jgi:hypothetical protein
LGTFKLFCTIPGLGQQRFVRVSPLVSKVNTSSGQVDVQ